MAGIKKLLGIIGAVAIVAAALFLGFGNSIEHIEDTNGADNYTLQTLNDGNIISRDVGAKGFSSTTDNITGRVKYSAKKFTGVTEVEGATSLGNSCTVMVDYFYVNEGNVKLVVMKDNEIVHEFTPNESVQQYTVTDAKGAYVSVRIAGESAKFQLELSI